MAWLAILGFGRRIGSAVFGWLSHASFWQLVAMALSAILVLQHFQLADARHDAAAYLKQRDGYKAQLDAISKSRNEQKAETQTRIVTVTKTIHDADGRAKQVETAPLPQTSCHGVTPPAVMGADL